MPTLRYTVAALIEAINAPGGPRARVPSDIGDRTPPTVAIDIIRESCLSERVPHVVVIDFAEHVLPNDQMQSASGDTARIVEQLARLATDTAWTKAGHRIVLIGRTARIDHRLTRLPGMHVLELGLPRLEERRRALELMTQSPRHKLVLAPELDLDRAARLSGGMSIQTLSAMRHHTSTENPLTVEDILKRKLAAIRQMAGDTLIVHDDLLSLDGDVAGLPQVRRFLHEELRRGNHTLRLILAGPPGNGKTRVATAIAAFLGVPAIELGHILNRYVGDSEANLSIALEAIEANAPCLVILDEVDQTFLGRRSESAASEGGQVTANLRAALFSWLGDIGSQRGISVIGLTNRPDLLDDAAVDRFTLVPVLHPTPWDAAQIMQIQARREQMNFDIDGAALALLEADSAFSGRQAVRLLGRAQVHALEQQADQIEGRHVASAIAESMQHIGAEEERQALLAIKFCSWAGHLPWLAARYLGDESAAVPAYLEPYVHPEGTLDRKALDERLSEVASLRGK
ncbi:ATPase central domain-containing protein (plasmid) [Arthrobacter sp. ZXY-2]|nr:ATPase central domain-containing protein [Arthrobacter sp. ZXY-2]